MNRKKIIIWGINLGLLLTVLILAWIFGPSVITEARYRQDVKAAAGGKPTAGFSAIMVSLSGFNKLTTTDIIKPLSSQFGLVIPKIFVNVAVTENVNPDDVKEYQTVLKQAGGVAHAAGTSVPGEGGTVYIFGHSTDATLNVERFNAVFYLLNKLVPGDKIIAYYNDVPYNYIVSEKKVVNPTDISDITSVSDAPRLVLQTCWPPGTTWKRLLIIALPEQI